MKMVTPKPFWEQEPGNKTDWKPQPLTPITRGNKKRLAKPKPVYFPFEIFRRTRCGYEKNVFVQNLINRVRFPFETVDIEKAISLYHLGTVQNGYRTGAVTFPFIDVKGNVRTIQVKQFDKGNHTTGTDFLHSIIEKHHTRNNKPLPKWLKAYLEQDKRVSCLFGAHLLNKHPHNPIALVEAPKTAIYGTLYFGFPEQPKNLLWLAVYNKSSFSLDKLKELQGRDIFVFPDLSKNGGTFKEWETKARRFEKLLRGTRFVFSDLLERLAPEQDRTEGNDLADYLIKHDWRDYKADNKNKTEAVALKPTATVAKNKTVAVIEQKAITTPKLHWRHLLKIPLDIRENVIRERNNGRGLKELPQIFDLNRKKLI